MGANVISEFAYDLATWLGGIPPHSVCLLYDPSLLFLQVMLDLGIALAYFAIPVGLFIFGRTLPFRSLVTMFMLFILGCGLTHVTKIAVLLLGGWTYYLHLAVSGLTLTASIITAAAIFFHGRALFALLNRVFVLASVSRVG